MSPMNLGLALASFVGAVSVLVGLFGLAAQGVLSSGVAAVLLPLAFVIVLSTLHAIVPSERPMVRRPGFWLLASAGVIGLPQLGSVGLFDPWETHYGEVAREMLARGDAVSTFWAHEGWFTSKPVLLFWMQAASLKVLGLHPESGRMLEGLNGRVAQPEWALRAPIFVVAIVGIYALYRCFVSVLGRRAAVVGAFAVGTSSLWILLARQSTTDMPLVGFLSAAMALFFAALNTKPDRTVVERTFRLAGREIRVHAGHVVALGICAVLLPQAAYLLSRNIAFFWTEGAHGFAWQADVVRLGSPGNCLLPGQIACGSQSPRSLAPPFAQGLGWLGAAVALSLIVTEEKRLARVIALAGWLFAALATMAKGPLGIVLPVATAVAWALTNRRPRALLELAPLRGLLIVGALVMPWYVATFMRHGRLFVDELVLRHMIGRTVEHLHDTNAGDDVSVRYYLAQLAFALLPWTGLALLGVGRALQARASRAERFLVVWALLAFALITVMRTKFHHYAFPVVPPLAMLAGITIVRARAERSLGPSAIFAAAVALAAGWALVSPRDPEGAGRLIHLFTYQYSRAWPENVDVRAVLSVLVIVAALAPLALLTRRWLRAAVMAAALATAMFSVNVVMAAAAPHWGQRAIMDVWARHKHESDAPLAAYQLNWKGENFYTGNRLALFGAGGGTDRVALGTWLDSLRTRGTRTVFVVTERSRIGGVKNEAKALGRRGGPAWHIEELTSETDSSQFCLLRVSCEGAP